MKASKKRGKAPSRAEQAYVWLDRFTRQLRRMNWLIWPFVLLMFIPSGKLPQDFSGNTAFVDNSGITGPCACYTPSAPIRVGLE